MKNKKVAKLVVDVYKTDKGELELRFPEPDIRADNKYDFVKLTLMAGEMLSFLKDQCTICNIDVDGRIKKLADLIIDDEGFQASLKQKAVADVDKYQKRLPFKPATGVGGQVVEFQQREEE